MDNDDDYYFDDDATNLLHKSYNDQRFVSYQRYFMARCMLIVIGV